MVSISTHAITDLFDRRPFTTSKRDQYKFCFIRDKHQDGFKSRVIEDTRDLGVFTLNIIIDNQRTRSCGQPETGTLDKKTLKKKIKSKDFIPIFCHNEVIIVESSSSFIQILDCVSRLSEDAQIAIEDTLWTLSKKEFSQESVELSSELVSRLNSISSERRLEALYQAYWVMFNARYEENCFEAALEFYKKFEKIDLELDPNSNMRCLAVNPEFEFRVGEAYYRTGEYNDAKLALEKYGSRSQIEGMGLRQSLSRIKLILGCCCQKLCEDRRAKTYFEEALSCAQNEKEREHAELSIAFLESFNNLKKNPERSAVSSEINAGSYFSDPVIEDLIKVYALIVDKKFDQAAILCEKIIGSSKINRRFSFHVLILEGLSLLALKSYQKAADCFLEAESLASEEQLKLEGLSSSSNLGLAYLRLGDLELAEKKLMSSIVISQKLHDEIDNYETKIIIYDEMSKAYSHLEEVFIKKGSVYQALEISDSRRARTLVNTLHKKTDQSIDINLPMNVGEIQEIAKKLDTTFLIYSLACQSQENPYFSVWIVSPGKELICKKLEGRIFLENPKMIEEFYQEFSMSNKVEVDVLPIAVKGGASSSSEASISTSTKVRGRTPFSIRRKMDRLRREYLNIWYDVLIKPVEKYLPINLDQTVTIVPDGYLRQIPFAVLGNSPVSDNQFLIEKCPISIIPSIRVLQLQDRIRLDRGPATHQKALIIGYPKAPDSRLIPLKIGKEEALVVSTLLGAEQVFLEGEATVAKFIEHAPAARWIFASCHGEEGCKPESDRHSVFEGQLRLAADPRHLSGNLHAEMISKLDLRTELVFLSACQSGTGKMQEEGIIGNIWSFFSAGASTVVGTYWPLPESKTTKKMVSRFYQCMLGIGGPRLDKAKALREAMLLGMAGDRREDFQQWGAFFLSGLSDERDTIAQHHSIDQSPTD